MKKKHIIIFICTLVIVTVGLVFLLKKEEWFENNKKKEENNIPNEVTPTPKDEFTYTPVMYKICDDDNCNYLVGAMHLGDPKITKLSDKVINAYKEMDSVAVEIDVDTSSIDVTKYMYKDGTTIEDHISEELIEKLNDFDSKHVFFMYDQYKNFKLGMFEDLISTTMYLELGYNTQGVDSYFMSKAKEDGKELISIEELETQLSFFDAYSDDLYAYIIEQEIDNYSNDKKLAKELYTAYLEGNADKIEEILKSEKELDVPDNLKEEMEKYNIDMLDNRNIVMSNAIVSYLANNKNVFVTVGAAHVIGENGIIDLLTNKEYKITSMN